MCFYQTPHVNADNHVTGCPEWKARPSPRLPPPTEFHPVQAFTMNPTDEATLRTIYQNCDKLKSYFGSFHNFMDSTQCNSKNIERHGCNEGSTRDGRNKVTAAAQSSSKDVKHHGSNKGSTRDVRSKITASSPSMEHLSSLSERNDIIQ